MAEQRASGIEAAQFSLPTSVVELNDPLMEPTSTERYAYLHEYYQKALLDGRNDGFGVFRAFFPPEPDRFVERAAGVTSEELLAFSKKMNESWTAAHPPHSAFILAAQQGNDTRLPSQDISGVGTSK